MASLHPETPSTGAAAHLVDVVGSGQGIDVEVTPPPAPRDGDHARSDPIADGGGQDQGAPVVADPDPVTLGDAEPGQVGLYRELRDKVLQGHLCAAGVVYLLLVATTRALRRRGFYKTSGTSEPALLEWLDRERVTRRVGDRREIL